MSRLIDWEQLDMIADGFTEEFVEIYHEFVAEIPGHLDALRAGCAAGDSVQVARTAHQLKGSAANFGFVGVSEPMATLEQEAKAGSIAGAEALTAAAEQGFREAVEEVRTLRGV